MAALEEPREELYRCQFCSFLSGAKKVMLKHIKDSHAHDHGFFINCTLCGRSFRVFSSFTSHVSRCHPGFLTENAYESCSKFAQDEQSYSGSLENENDFSMESDHNCGVLNDCGPMEADEKISLSAGKFIVGLKEKHLVTQSCIDFVVEGVTNLTDTILDVCKAKLLNTLGESASNISLDDTFDSSRQPFKRIPTAYHQTQFIKNNLSYVEPKEIKLGSRWVTDKSKKGAGGLVSKEDKFVYIPILETLQQLLSNDAIRKEVTKPYVSCDGLLRYICDGWQAKEHEGSINNKGNEVLNLSVLAYFDEIEVCNPLGSRAKVHKLGVFYFTLANIHPMFRSKLSSIFLLAVVKSSNLTRYGFNQILQPFVDEMKQLTTGKMFTVNHQQLHIKGSLLLFLADTLAAHQLGGFKVGVGFSFRKCRNCLATLDDINDKFHCSLFLPRSPELHVYHCSLLKGNLASFNSTTYGVSYDSCLNEIPLFNVADWQLPQDVMHVLLEGVLPFEMKLLLHNFIFVQKLFSVDDFNSRLEAFQFGYSESKPSRIDSTHLLEGNLRQSASQCWALGRFLPLLIGDLIPSNDRLWECYLYLHDILAICMSPCVSPMTVSYLSELIRIHHGLFKDNYNVNMTPKLHYMVHFPESIKRFGPLVRYWCMRMEAKNAYTKKAANKGNFKNITLSFAQRHQRLLALTLTDPKIMSLDYLLGPEIGHSTQLEKAQDSLKDSVLNVFPEANLSDYLHRSKWIKLGNLDYRQGAAIFVGFEGILPTFGIVNEVLSICSKPLLRVKKCITQGLDENYRSYVVTETSQTILLNVYCLPDYSIMHTHHSFSQTDHSFYICLKWNLESTE